MVMGRMVYNFTPSASVFKVKAWRFGLIFVLLDVFAFLVQLGGAAVAGVNDDEKTAMLVSFIPRPLTRFSSVYEDTDLFFRGSTFIWAASASNNSASSPFSA